MSALATFWWLMSIAAVIWFSTVTVIVAFRGAGDIRRMLAKLKEEHEAEGRERR